MYVKNARVVDSMKYQFSKPKFNKKVITFMREEKGGYITCHSGKVPHLKEILINPTASRILEFCNGEKTPKELSTEILSFFKNANELQVALDLKDVLFEYSKFGLLNWEETGNPFMNTMHRALDEGYTICLAEEEDLRLLKDFFSSNTKVEDAVMLEYLNPVRELEEYTDEITYRAKLFMYAEEFFLLKNSMGILEGVVSVLLPTHKKSTTPVIGVIRISEKFFDQVFYMVKDILKDVAVSDISKIKYQSILNKQSDEQISKRLLNLGFNREGLLVNEIGHESIEVFSFIY